MLIIATLSYAEVYEYRDKDGTIMIGIKPPEAPQQQTEEKKTIAKPMPTIKNTMPNKITQIETPLHNDMPKRRWSFGPIIFLIIIIAAIYIWVKASKKKEAEKKSIIQRRIEDVKKYFNQINQEKKIPAVETSLLLKKGEVPYLNDRVNLLEMGKYTISRRGGGAVRVAKGVYIGGTTGKSRSYDELRDKDTGELVLTNKRLIFDGGANTREISLDKILSVTNHFDAIEVASEGKVKSLIFTGMSNPILWKALIYYIRQIPESGELPNAALEIH